MSSRIHEEIIRRTLAIVDVPFTFEFLGEHTIPPGTEFVLGQEEGRAVLGEFCDLLLRVSPEMIVKIPHGHFHLEVEQETRYIQMRIERWMAPLV